MAISKKLKAFYMGIWEKPELWTANCINFLQEWKSLNKYCDKSYKLTRKQKKQIREFWKPYTRVSTKWCRYYSAKNGIFDPRYIPNTLAYERIDQHFNNRRLGYGFNDKNYYATIFQGIPQPVALVRKIGKLLFDGGYHQLTVGEAMAIICEFDEVIIKPSQESGSGRGIWFCKPDKERERLAGFLGNKNETNFIIQKIVKQHPDLAAVHKASINTMRICTVMLEDGVHVLSSVLRMGINESRIDNVSAGGISARIMPDGKLDKYAYTYDTGERFERHPQGLVFEGHPVPSFEKAIETVKIAAQRIGNFRMVSWDVAVDENGEVLLIEANMRKGDINMHQFENGPLFGDLTERVLNEVYGINN